MKRLSIGLILASCLIFSSAAIAQTNADLKTRTQTAVQNIRTLSQSFADATANMNTSEVDAYRTQFMSEHKADFDEANNLRDLMLVRLNREVPPEKLLTAPDHVGVPTSQLSDLARKLPN